MGRAKAGGCSLYVPNRHEHDLLVSRTRLLGARPRHVDLLAPRPPLREERDRHPREGLPDLRARPEPLRELGALRAVLAADDEGRETGGFRPADPGRGGAEGRLRTPDVPAVLE